MKSIKALLISSIVIATLSLSLFAQTKKAGAQTYYTHNYPAISCGITSGTSEYSNGQLQSNSSTALQLQCPLPTNGNALGEVYVYGWNGSTTYPITANICSEPTGGGAPSCGGNDGAVTTGAIVLTPGDTRYSTTGFNYININLGANSTGNALFGYTETLAAE
jgi:hypothetical protein